MTMMLPRRAERTVMTARAAMAARKTVSLLLRMARMAAMKKVLSPSSDTLDEVKIYVYRVSFR